MGSSYDPEQGPDNFLRLNRTKASAPDPLRGLLLQLCISAPSGLERLDALLALGGWRLLTAPKLDSDGSCWVELIAPAISNC